MATTTQIQDFARNVGRERITLLAILPPNSDPHDYQPTAEDARKIAQADVIFYNGIGLEPWIDDLSKNARPQVPAVSLAEAAGLTIKQRAEDGDEHEGEHDTGDPHVWYDPTNARKMVDTIRATLSSVESAGAPAYAASAAAYQAELDELDRQIQQLVATIPANGRKLVTSHESFRYYADRYGFAYLGAVIPSISTEAEPSAAEIQKLVQTIRREQVRAIFTDRSWNPRLEERIAQQAGVKVVSSLYGDTLGPAGSEGDTYIRAMLYNTRVIVEALR